MMKIEYRKVNIWDIKALSPISERKQRGERNIHPFKQKRMLKLLTGLQETTI